MPAHELRTPIAALQLQPKPRPGGHPCGGAASPRRSAQLGMHRTKRPALGQLLRWQARGSSAFGSAGEMPQVSLIKWQ